MEEVAGCYLMELTQRSLLEVIERNAHGRARSFPMHDLVREVTLIPAKKEKFAIAYGNVGEIQVGCEACRLCIHKGARPQSLKFSASSQLRSFILLNTEVSSSWIYDTSSHFRLLRVLCLRFANIEQVPGVVTVLFNLHYLDLSYTKVKEIPGSFGQLLNLQVLDLRFSYVEELPSEITTLTNLRHLHVFATHDIQERSFNFVSATKISGDICHLKNLQALQCVSANKDLVLQLRNLTLMRSLLIMKMQQKYIAQLWDSLMKMPSLTRLGMSACDKDEVLKLKMLRPFPNLKSFWLAGKLDEGVLPPIFANFEKLTQLRLDWSGLKKDPISSLSNMLNLVELSLFRSYVGEQLTFCAGWFPKLHTLYLVDMEQLNWIEIKDGTMKGLHHLELIGLKNLNAVPDGIKYIRTLHQMFLTEMPKEFIDRLQVSDSKIVQHIPGIHIFDSSDSQAVWNSISSRHFARKYGSCAITVGKRKHD